MNIIGIDPGGSGAIAMAGDDAYADFWNLGKMTEKDVFDTLTKLKDECNPQALIEAVHSMPGAGVTGMFKFGVSYGGLRMALIAAGIPFEAVAPQRWKTKIGLARKPKEPMTVYKNRSKARAQELFPHLKITHANAEALLLAWYGSKRVEKSAEVKV